MTKVHKRDAWGAVAVSLGAEIFLWTGLMGACINKQKMAVVLLVVMVPKIKKKKKKIFHVHLLHSQAPSLDGGNLRHHRMGLTGLTCPLRSHSPHSSLPECSGPRHVASQARARTKSSPVSPNMSSEFKHSMWVLALMEWFSVFLTKHFLFFLFFFLAGEPNAFNATLNKWTRS